jgi:hypothetical protein
VEIDDYSSPVLPRVVPSGDRIKSLLGIWQIDGEMIRLLEEPGTGVLVAINLRGERVNPLRVISHGTKLQEPELH